MEEIIGILLRLTITYFYLLAIIRLSGKRTILEGTPLDFIVALMIGDFPDDIIWGEVPVARGIVGLGTIMLLHLLVVYLSYRSIAFDQLVNSAPLPLIKEGHFVRQNMRRERENEAELWSLLRMQQIEELRDVRVGTLEPTGQMTVLLQESAKPAEKRDLPLLKETLR